MQRTLAALPQAQRFCSGFFWGPLGGSLGLALSLLGGCRGTEPNQRTSEAASSPSIVTTMDAGNAGQSDASARESPSPASAGNPIGAKAQAVPNSPEQLASARREVLQLIEQAADLEGRHHYTDALVPLARARGIAPGSARLALELGRLEGLAGNPLAASNWAKRALRETGANSEVHRLAMRELNRAQPQKRPEGSEPTRQLTQNSPQPPNPGPFQSIQQACDGLKGEIRLGRGPFEAQGEELSNEIVCREEMAFPGAGSVRKWRQLRVQIPGAEQKDVIFLLAEGPLGFLPSAPLVQQSTTLRYGLPSAPEVTVTPANGLSGGNPSVVVQIRKRQTRVDVAQNERLEADTTSLRVLQVVGAALVSSREITLARSETTSRLLESDSSMPKNWAPSADLGTTRYFQLKLTWGAEGTVQLSRIAGNWPRPEEGTLQLFPERLAAKKSPKTPSPGWIAPPDVCF